MLSHRFVHMFISLSLLHAAYRMLFVITHEQFMGRYTAKKQTDIRCLTTDTEFSSSIYPVLCTVPYKMYEIARNSKKIRTCSSSRSSKVINLGANRKLILSNFLLVINSNFERISHRLYRKPYEKSIGTKMDDLDFCLEVVSRSCQPLRNIRRWISRKPVEIEAYGSKKDTNRKWSTGNQLVTWPITSRVHERSKSWPQYA